jgi:phosphoglycolate phosphatase-like HAD superfamily hydrolase
LANGQPDIFTWRDEAPEPGLAAVFDLDGVLSDAAGRQHFVDGSAGRKDWRAFFDRVGDDPLVEEINHLLHWLDPRLAIVLLTARPARVRPQTLAWLERYGVRWDLLVMRPDGDLQPAVAFKQSVVAALRSLGFELKLAFEDDRRNVAMFRHAGVPCVYIHSGYYE